MVENKVILAGCGGMANLWLDYVAERADAQIVGLVDVQLDAAVSLSERRGLQVPVFTDLAKAIAETDANIVFDVTIPAAHKDIAITALQAGCHVFTEKPMAESLEDACSVLSIVKQTGQHYAVMQNRRYLQQIRNLRELISNEAIGPIGSIHADFFIGAHFGGFRDLMEHPLIIDMAIHTFDQARFISDANPVSVYCHEYNPPGSWFKGNASAICIFEMSNGAVFTYRGSWCAEGRNTSWESDWRITGETGSITWDGREMPIGEVVDPYAEPQFIRKTKTLDIPNTWNGREGHFGCLDEMFLALQEGRPAETSGFDNIESMKMVFGAIESAKSGQKIVL